MNPHASRHGASRRGRWALSLGLLLLGACSHQAPLDTLGDVPEIRPGLLAGYLPMAELPNSVSLIPPPPGEGSAALARDEARNREALALQGSARWDLATEDAHLAFPAAAGTFSCALQAPITEQDTPNLYRLLRRTLVDAGLATYGAKNLYARTRPFVVNGRPSCTPEEEAMLAQDGSYPSGHTAAGWAWALILAELAPERADAVLARGRAFGDSRMICNVHWLSDVEEGRMVGAAAVAKLHSDPLFAATMQAARMELQDARARNLAPTRDCAQEARALAGE